MTENLEDVDNLSEHIGGALSAARGIVQVILNRCRESLDECSKEVREFTERRETIITYYGPEDQRIKWVEEMLARWQDLQRKYEEHIRSYESLLKR